MFRRRYSPVERKPDFALPFNVYNPDLVQTPEYPLKFGIISICLKINAQLILTGTYDFIYFET